MVAQAALELVALPCLSPPSAGVAVSHHTRLKKVTENIKVDSHEWQEN